MENVSIVREQSSEMLQNSNIVTSIIIEQEADDDETVDGNNINLSSLSINSSTKTKTISSPPANSFVTSSNFVSTTPLNHVSTTTTPSFVLTLLPHPCSHCAPSEDVSNSSLPSTLNMTE
jgi:hypothetical protein